MKTPLLNRKKVMYVITKATWGEVSLRSLKTLGSQRSLTLAALQHGELPFPDLLTRSIPL